MEMDKMVALTTKVLNDLESNSAPIETLLPKGKIRNPWEDPISRHLITFGIPQGFICVSLTHVWLSDSKNPDEFVDLPPRVAEFMTNFDSGLYPHLLEDHN